MSKHLTAEKVSYKKILLMGISFIFLFQTFFYIKDFYILYVFSKVVLGVAGCFFLFGYLIRSSFLGELPKHSSFLLLLFIVLLLLSTVSSHVVFGQPYLFGILAQIKLTAIFYYFIALSLLMYLKPSTREVEKTFIYTALFLLTIYIAANVLLSPKALWTKESDIVINDSKGYRFRLPDVFIVIYLFYVLRNYLAGKKRVLMTIITMLIIAYLFFLQQERAEFFCIIIVVMWRLITKAPIMIKVLFITVITGILLYVTLLPNEINDILASLNNSSLSIRETTVGITYRYLSSGFLHTIFGAGNLNELWQGGFLQLYGQNFYLSDIGWAGITYEFGLIGIIFCLITYLKILKDTEKTGMQSHSLMIYAFADYILVRLLLSVLAPSIPYYIGIFTTILAISVYLRIYKKKSYEK